MRGIEINIGGNLAELDKALGQVQSKLQRFSGQLASVGTAMSAALTVPITLAAKQVLSVAGNFEESMQAVSAVSGATGEEFDKLREKAKALGAATQFSATEAAQGIEMLARNGLKAGDILNGTLDSTLNLAAATGTDLSTAANIATDVMASFNIKAADMAQVVDKITGVTTNSKFSIEDYAYALAQGGGVAASVGVSLDDFNTTIAATSSLFSSGSDAGTAFKTFLTSLAPKTKEAKQLQKELGLSFFDSNGQMKSMSDISQQLQNSFSKLSDEQKNNAASTLFGTDAMRTALALAKTGGEEFDRLSKSIKEVSAAQQAAERLKGFNGEIKKLQSAFEGLLIAIGDSGFLGFITSIVAKLSEFVSGLSKADPQIMRFGTAMAGIAAIAGPAALALSKLPAIISPLQGLFKGLAILLSPVALKIIAIVAAIGGLVLIGKSVYDTWSGIGKFFSDLWEVISFMFTQKIREITGLWNSFMNFLGLETKDVTDFFKDIGKVAAFKFEQEMKAIEFDKLWDNIKSNFLGFVDFAKETGEKIGYYLSGDFLSKNLKTSGEPKMPDAWTPKKKEVTDVFASVRPKDTPLSFETRIDLSGDAFQSLFEAFKRIEAESAVFGASFDMNTAKVQALQDAMVQLALVGDEEGFAKLKSILEGLQTPVDALGESIERVFASVVTELGNAVAAVASGSESIGSAVKRIISALIAQGVAAIISGTILTNPTPLGLAAASAAGVAASALFNAAIPAFATGGGVFGPTVGLMGEYVGASTNPEIIAPLDMLQDMIAGSGGSENVNVSGTFKVSGDDLILVLDRANKSQRNRFGV